MQQHCIANIKERLLLFTENNIVLVEILYLLCITTELLITAIFLCFHSIWYFAPLCCFMWLLWYGRAIWTSWLDEK